MNNRIHTIFTPANAPYTQCGHTTVNQITRSLTLWFALFLPCALLPGCEDTTDLEAQTSQEVSINGKTFTLELALDPPSRFQGLSDRPQINDNGGMLFVFPKPAKLRFVMRRCLVPIDLIYLDATGRVITTYSMTVEPTSTPEAQLKQYTSPWPAQYAIELKGGTVKGLHLSKGQKIDLPLDKLKQHVR